jgi:AraC-like DNA-binding protein
MLTPEFGSRIESAEAPLTETERLMPMTSRMQMTTSDPAEMTAVVEGILPTISVGARKPGKFSAEIDAVQLDEVSMMRISTRNIAVSSEPGGKQTTLTIPLLGDFEVEQSGRRDSYGGQHANVHNLDREFDLSSANFSVLVVNVENSILATTGDKLCRDNKQSWTRRRGHLSLTRANGARIWRSAYSLWSAAQKMHRAPVSPFAIAEQQGAVVEAMLHVVGADQGPQPSQLENRRNVTRLAHIEDWITANIAGPITRADLCDISGLSARALTRAFASRHGRGPLQFVRDRRVEAVQRILLGSKPEETTVTQVAMDMGFLHLGRFATDYRARFGESPSDTLGK